MSDNLCNLKTFLIKTSTTVLTSRNLKAIKYYNFVSLSITIIMFVYSLLFSKLMTKLIEISHHCHIEISIDSNNNSSNKLDKVQISISDLNYLLNQIQLVTNTKNDAESAKDNVDLDSVNNVMNELLSKLLTVSQNLSTATYTDFIM